MEETGYLLSLKHALWQVLAGTRGGAARIQIIELLKDRPYNVNQLHEKLCLDYKTVQHHIKVLRDSRIIENDDNARSRYGSMYFLAPLLERNMVMYEEILAKTGQREIKKVYKIKK
jgi:predicted transcriptional regulator